MHPTARIDPIARSAATVPAATAAPCSSSDDAPISSSPIGHAEQPQVADFSDLTGLTIRDADDELWFQFADDQDAWMGIDWRETEPHCCKFTGCCDERVSVQL